jgi:FixJ family two-component response regulator
MLPSTPIVFVVDDDALVRRSLALLIESGGWHPETFACASDFLSCPRVLTPSCLVLDVTLPDVDGLELQKRLAMERTAMPIIFVSGYGNVPMTVQAMKAGAMEFLTKPLNSDALLTAIRHAIDRSASILDEQNAMQALRECYSSLTCREREVMTLVVSGLLNKQIGVELAISEITVKAHRGSMMRKMKADSLAHLVNMASRLGISPWDDLGRSSSAVWSVNSARSRAGHGVGFAATSVPS